MDNPFWMGEFSGVNAFWIDADEVGNNHICPGTSGDDAIVNLFSQHLTVDSGSGNDTVDNQDGHFASINAGNGNNVISNTGNYATIITGDGNDTIQGFNDSSTLSIASANYSTAVSGNNVVVSVGEGSITLVDAVNLNLNIDFYEETIPGDDETTLNLTDDSAAQITLTSSIEVADASSRTKTISIIGNEMDNTITGGSNKNTLRGGDGNDSIVGGKTTDKLYGDDGNDTIAGGEGNDTLFGGDGDDLFVYSAGNDIIADYAAGDVISIGAAISKSSFIGNNAILTIGSNKLTIKNGKGKELSLIEADGTARTIIGGASLLSDSSSAKVTLKSSIAAADASARTKAIKLFGNALDNTIFGGSGKDTLYGVAGDDYLAGGAGSDKLYGQDGNDTLFGGNGDDLFVYSAGNDVIYDYAAGDVISIGAAISKSSFSGNNAILTIGSNKLTIKNGKGKELSLIEADGTARTIIGGASLLSDSSASKVTLKSSYAAADASARTTAIKLVGNSLDNTIFGGSGNDTIYGVAGDDYLAGGAGSDKLYGQDGNDTLWGGIGNDTLKGGDGSDTYLYNAGKDVIYGFANDDMLQITADTFTASLNAAGDVVFKVDSTASAITLKDFTAETFNINGDTYKISGKKLVPNS